MEEKERYEWNSRFDEAIKDNQTGDIVNAVEVLNKQDKRIKELEQESYPAYKREHKRRAYLENIEVPRLEKENQLLKQQLAEMEKDYQQLKGKLHTSEQETLHFHNKYFAEKQIAIEELNKARETAECVLDNALKNSSLNESYYDRLIDEIDNQIKAIKEMR